MASPIKTRFLRARDPSISPIKTRGTNMEQGESSSNSEAPSCMQIHLRIKRTELLDTHHEFDEDTITCNFPGDAFTRKYKFSKIFGPESTQTELFNNVVKPKIFDFMNGTSSTLLTYGASGSGKTFTIVGTATDPGLIPRTLEYLFQSLPDVTQDIAFKPHPTGNLTCLNTKTLAEESEFRKQLFGALKTAHLQHAKTYEAMQQRLSLEPTATTNCQFGVLLGVWVSFAEIYNENVYDLLKTDLAKGIIREKMTVNVSDGQPYIKDLTSVKVSNGLEAYQILQYGLHNLNYAATCVNSHSSRSHCIFSINLVQTFRTGEFVINYFNFCDLAGSERVKKTLNVGERLKESKNINNSLLVLRKCITAIQQNQKRHHNKLIAFRESKLTQLLQRPLSGLEDISMIVNINLNGQEFAEAKQTLTFSAIAKDIAIQKQQKLPTQSEECSLEIKNLQQLISSLTAELEELVTSNNQYKEDITSELRIAQYKHIADFSQRFENQVQMVTKYYSNLLEEDRDLPRQQYEVVLQRQMDNEVITIDSSEDEDDLEKRDEFTELHMKKLQAGINQLLKENDHTINQLNDTVCSQNERKAELKSRIRFLKESRKNEMGICHV